MTFPRGTKVICIDATPIPILCGSQWEPGDFEFPGGFLVEGQIYCVTRAVKNHDGSYGLHLAGHPMIVRGKEGNWHGSRFRIVEKNKEGQKAASRSKKEKDKVVPAVGL